MVVHWNCRWWLFPIDNCRWWLFGIDVGGCLELSFVVVWNVWNGRWWLVGMDVGGSKLGIVVGGCPFGMGDGGSKQPPMDNSKQPPTFGIVDGGCLELSLVVVWNCRWWLLGIVDNWL